MSFIQEYLQRSTDPLTVGEITAGNYAGTVASVRMLDRLLGGLWTEADEAEFLVPLLGGARPKWEAAVASIRDWYVEHPQGVERELAG